LLTKRKKDVMLEYVIIFAGRRYIGMWWRPINRIILSCYSIRSINSVFICIWFFLLIRVVREEKDNTSLIYIHEDYCSSNMNLWRIHMYFVFLIIKKPSWSWSYGIWINNYQCNQYLSPFKLSVRIPLIARYTRYNIMW
jgi:hypothetical protein